MADKSKRFEKVEEQSSFLTNFSIWVDRETGVNYVLATYGQGTAMTPLLGRDGKPVITAVSPYDED